MGGTAKGKKKMKNKNKTRREERIAGGLPERDWKKLRMTERAKKKTSEKYSVEQLLQKTEEYMDTFDFGMASRFCERALDLEPNNLQTIDMMGHIYSEMGEIQKAKDVFLRAVRLSPDEGHSKYMSLGQIHTGQESVDYYSKGIQILLSQLDKHSRDTVLVGAAAPSEEDPESPTPKHICLAYCNVAEIYLTDLCMEEGAADKCRESIEKALHYHHDNPEALQLMASYLFSTERNQEGREYLLRSVGVWLPTLKTTGACPSAEEEHLQNKIPPYEFRISTTKLLMETEEYEMAVDVLECLLEEDDEVVEVWYLSGWVCYLQMERAKELQARERREPTGEEAEEHTALKDAARSYLTQAKKLHKKLRCEDNQLLEHVETLLEELGGELKEEEGEEELEGGQGDPELDEDFEPSSDDEEDEESAMEH